MIKADEYMSCAWIRQATLEAYGTGYYVLAGDGDDGPRVRAYRARLDSALTLFKATCTQSSLVLLVNYDAGSPLLRVVRVFER